MLEQQTSNHSPFDFVSFLMSNKLLQGENISIFIPNKIGITPKVKFSYHYHAKIGSFLEDLKNINACLDENNDILQEDIYIWIRRCWLEFFKMIKESKITNLLQEIGCYFFLEQIKKLIKNVEKKYKKKLWSNYIFTDFEKNWFRFDEKEFTDICKKNYCSPITNQPFIPFLKTHISDFSKNPRGKFYKQSFYQRIYILQLLIDYDPSPNDLFPLLTQNGQAMMKFCF